MTTTMRTPLEAGQLVAVGVAEADGRHWYRARVADVDGDLIWIEAPVPADVAEPRGANDWPPGSLPALGAEALIHTWRLMDARYTLRGTVVVVDPAAVDGRIGPMVGLRIVAGERVQDREYLRVPVSMDARGAIRDGDGRVELFPLRVHDLSAGGLRARSDRSLELEQELLVTMRLPEDSVQVIAHAKVARVIDPPTPRDPSCEIGLAFIDLPQHAREQIIRYAMSVQLEWRRRGML